MLKRSGVLELHGIALALDISVTSSQTVLHSILHPASIDEGFQWLRQVRANLIFPRTLSFYFWSEQSVVRALLTEEAVDDSFCRRFLITRLKVTILSSLRLFVLMPCTRRHIAQYFRFHSVVHFIMCSCSEQNYTPLYAFRDQGWWNVQRVGLDQIFHIYSKNSKRRQDKYVR